MTVCCCCFFQARADLANSKQQLQQMQMMIQQMMMGGGGAGGMGMGLPMYAQPGGGANLQAANSIQVNANPIQVNAGYETQMSMMSPITQNHGLHTSHVNHEHSSHGRM